MCVCVLSSNNSLIFMSDKVKPCISHRDMNSRNVLVRVDLSCALCDMGFAMKIAGSKYYSQTGEEQHAETTSLIDVSRHILDLTMNSIVCSLLTE